MKKIFATLTVLAMFSFGSVAVMAQDAAEAAPVAEEVTVDSAAVEAPVAVEAEEVVEEDIFLDAHAGMEGNLDKVLSGDEALPLQESYRRTVSRGKTLVDNELFVNFD